MEEGKKSALVEASYGVRTNELGAAGFWLCAADKCVICAIAQTHLSACVCLPARRALISLFGFSLNVNLAGSLVWRTRRQNIVWLDETRTPSERSH